MKSSAAPIQKQMMQKTFRRMLLGFPVALLLAACPWTSQAQPLPVTDNAAAPYLGVFTEGFRDGNGMRMDNFFAEWLRRSSVYAMVFAGSDGDSGGQVLWTWDAIAGNVTYSKPVDFYARWCNAHPNSKLMISLATLPGIGQNATTGYTHARGARGDYDTYFRQLAEKLRDRGICDQIIIRPAWEFNGNWYPWKIVPGSAEMDAPHFAAYFCRIVRVMQGRDGNLPATSTTDPGQNPANIKFNWCGTKYRHQILPYNVRAAYPGGPASNPAAGTPAAATSTGVSYPAYSGDDYVDTVGVDIYDVDAFANTYNNSNPPYSQTIANNNFNYTKGSDSDDNNGIARWKAIAVEHGKTLSFPEWGLSNESRTTSLPAGGFDNAYFITNMFNYIQDPANNVEYAFYFEDDNSNSRSRISPFSGYTTIYPNAALKYRQLFTPALPTRTNIGSITATTSADGLNVRGAGAGYTGTADNFYFTSRACPTLDMMMVKLTSASVAAGQSGLMLRQNTTAGAVNAALFVSNGSLLFQHRTAASGTTTSSTVASGATYPLWLKLVRNGTAVTAYRSADGLNWSYAAGQTLTALSGTAQIGMAVSSGAAGTLNTAGIDRLDDPFHAMGEEAGIANKIIKDNADTTGITITGTGWAPSSYVADHYAADYLLGEPSDGAMSVAFNPGLTSGTAGLCDVYLHWPTYKAGAYDAPITVNYNGTGSPASLTGNQIAGAEKWVYAGTYNMNSASNVVLGNSLTTVTPGLDEYTIVDAVMFVPLPAAPAGPVVYEAETVAGITASSGDVVSVFSEASASGGAGSKLASNAATDFIQYPLLNVPAGTYTVKVRYKRNTTRGIFQLSIDGTDFGSVVDEYGTGAYVEATVGTGKTLSAGTHNFKFTVTGKNAGSTGYDLTVDSITLQP